MPAYRLLNVSEWPLDPDDRSEFMYHAKWPLQTSQEQSAMNLEHPNHQASRTHPPPMAMDWSLLSMSIVLRRDQRKCSNVGWFVNTNDSPMP